MKAQVFRWGRLAGVLFAVGVASTPSLGQGRDVERDSSTPDGVAAVLAGGQFGQVERYSQAGAKQICFFDQDVVVDQGTRRVNIRWSYAPDGLFIDEPGNESSPDDPDDPPSPTLSSLFTTLGSPTPIGFGQQQAWQQIVADAFDRWEAISGVSFIFVGGASPVSDNPNPDSGDRWDQASPGTPEENTAGIGEIRIGMRELDGFTNASNGLGSLQAFVYDTQIRPPLDEFTGTDPLTRVPNWGYLSNIVLDRDERWNDPLVPNLFATVIARSIGKAIGIQWACPNTFPINPANPQVPYALMQNQFRAAVLGLQPFPQLLFQEPQEDDLRAAQFLYGDPLEDNNNYAIARNITYRPVPGTGEFTFAPHLGLPPETFGRSIPMSLSGSGGVLCAVSQPVEALAFLLGLYETLTISTSGGQMIVTSTNPALSFQYFFNDPALDTLGELAARINIDFGQIVTVVTGISPNTPSAFLLTNPGLTLDALNFEGSLNIQGTGVPGVAPPDVDFFRIGFPDSFASGTLTVTVQPVGSTYVSGLFDEQLTGGDCFPDTVPVNASSIHNLRIRIESFDPLTGQLLLLAEQNATAVGNPETLELPVSSGTYFISIRSDNLVNDVQLYNLTINVEQPITAVGDSFALAMDSIGLEAFRNEGFFGTSAVVGNIDGQLPNANHITLSDRPQTVIAWPGIEPAVLSVSSHATSALGLAVGSSSGSFEGVAPQAEYASASVATTVFPDGTFNVGKVPMFFALMGLTDRNLARSLGLAGAVDVVNSTWGAGGRLRNGEDSVSQAFDSFVSQKRVTVVTAVGNDGQAEGRSFPDCEFNPGDPDSPGTRFLGSRSVISPALAFNTIAVGAAATSDGVTYDLVAAVSSRGPIDSFAFGGQGTDVLDNRPGVDIIAPGTGLSVIPPLVGPDGQPINPCFYDGPLATNFLSVPAFELANPTVNSVFRPAQGTSLAASVVSGAVALLADVAKSQDPPLSTHPAVMKAVLLTGAEKLQGWTNNPALTPGQPQDNRDGFAPDVDGIVLNFTARPLDLAQGAGLLNFQRSLEIYATGYPPAIPPQAQFPGPTIDPPETDPRVPTIRRPVEPTGPGIPTAPRSVNGDPEIDPAFVAEAQEGLPPSPIEIANLLRTARGGDELFDPIARPMGIGDNRGDPDLRNPRGPSGPGVVTGPQTPFSPPSLGGGSGSGGGSGGSGGGSPGGPPGAIDPGVRPREIEAIVVNPIGWDHANIDQRAQRLPGGTSVVTGFIDYVINVPLLTGRPDPNNPGQFIDGDELFITLSWLRDVAFDTINLNNPNDPRIGTVRTLELEDLDLSLFLTDGQGTPVGPAIRGSNANLNNTEHIAAFSSQGIAQDGVYMIRVQWVGTDYDVFFNLPLAEVEYGLAWRVEFGPRPTLPRPTGVSDLIGVVRAYGGKIGNQYYDLDADMDKDGKVAFSDVTFVLTNFDPVRASTVSVR